MTFIEPEVLGPQNGAEPRQIKEELPASRDIPRELSQRAIGAAEINNHASDTFPIPRASRDDLARSGRDNPERQKLRAEIEAKLKHRTRTGLLASVATGNEVAIRELVSRINGSGIGRARKNNSPDPEGTAQTAWQQLLSKLPTIQNPDVIEAWFFTAINWQTGRDRDEGFHRHEIPIDLTDEASNWGTTIGSLSEMADIVTKEEARAVRTVIEGLKAKSPTHYRVLHYRFLHPNASYKEISDHLNMPIGSIGPTWMRVVARIKEKLDSISDDTESLAAALIEVLSEEVVYDNSSSGELEGSLVARMKAAGVDERNAEIFLRWRIDGAMPKEIAGDFGLQEGTVRLIISNIRKLI